MFENLFSSGFDTLDRRRLWLPGYDEIIDSFFAISWGELCLIIGFFLWFVILAIPLSGIDRRDEISCGTYASFMTFAAVCLMMALPKDLGLHTNYSAQILGTLVLGLIAVFRWHSHRLRTRSPVRPEKTTGGE